MSGAGSDQEPAVATVRRTGLLLLGDNHGLAAAPVAGAMEAELLGWSEVDTTAQLASHRLLAAGHGVPGGTPRVSPMA